MQVKERQSFRCRLYKRGRGVLHFRITLLRPGCYSRPLQIQLVADLHPAPDDATNNSDHSASLIQHGSGSQNSLDDSNVADSEAADWDLDHDSNLDQLFSNDNRPKDKDEGALVVPLV